MGSLGRTVGPLNPSGVVLIDNERVPAQAEFGWIDAETEVEVVSDERFGVIVRPQKTDAD
jgi:membrane-bound ClpP family serine protease